jgi:hypothetical protein
MSKIKLFLIINLTILSLNYNLFSQKISQSYHPSIGVVVPILDSGLGISLAMNAHQPLNRYIGVEGQLSFISARINSSFISGRSGYSNAANALLGLRLYFNPKDEFRFYINGLIGASYVKEKLNGLSLEPEFTGGVSLGAFFDFNQKYILGLSLESPSFLIFRFGYML